MWLPGGNYQYYLKDHLGNTRLAVNTSGQGGTVVQQTDYYPFGMDIACYNGGLDNKYRYNGKEFQEDVINSKPGCRAIAEVTISLVYKGNLREGCIYAG
jgi:hypothetical protein